MKKLLTALSVAALTAVPAFAQETTLPKTSPMPAENQAAPMPSENQAASPDATVVTSGMVGAKELLNKSVKNAANETIGDINDLQLDSSGKVIAVIVGVGGFLGLGEKNVGLPYDQLSFTRDGEGSLVITANVTKESLQSAPAWKHEQRS